MKNSTILAHWASKKCASLGTINKNRYYLFIIIMLLTFGAGNAWGADYIITFKSASSDNSNDLGSNPSVANVVADGASYVENFSSCSKMYVGKSGVKLGSSNNSGTMNFTLKANCQSNIKSIKVVSAIYGSDKGTLTLYSGSTSLKSGISPGTDYTHTFTSPSKVASIKLVSTKRAYITKIIITTEETPFYTVNWTINPAESGELSATTGNSVTVTPNEAYTYGDPAYIVTPAGKADVSKNGNQFTASNLTADCSIQINMTPKTPAKIVFENMGSPAPKTDGYYVGDTYTLPNENDFTCGNRTFVGWSTVTIDNSANKPIGNTYYEPGAEVTLEANNTFYAVFAEGSGEEVLTSITGGDWSNGLSAGWTTTGTETYSGGNGVKFDGKNDEVSSPDISSKKYKSLLLKFKSGYNGNKGSVLTFYTYKNDGTLLKDDNVTISPETVIPSDTYTNQTSIYQVRISASEVIGYVMIMMTSKTSNLGMKYCEIFGVSNSYQNYTTSCSEPVQTANYTIKHYQQNILDDEYTLVEADTEILSGEVGTEVTPEVKKYTGFTAPSTKTITISLDGSTVVDYKYNRNSYTLMWNLCGGTITKEGTAEGLVKFGATLTPPIVEKEGHNFKDWNSNPTTMPASDVTYTAQWAKLYTIIWLANGDEFHKQANAEEGTKLDVPTEEPTACEGKAFVGWTAKRDYAHTSQAPSDLFKTNDINVESAENVYYAVFATMTSIPGETTIEEVSTELDFSKQGYSNEQEVTSLTKDDVTIKLNKGTNNNATKYYNTGTAVRVYGGGYFTVSVPNENTIDKIVLTFGSGDDSNTITTSSPTYENGTWTGEASSVTFSVGGSSGHRRIKVVAVTHTTTIQTEGSIEYSNYSTTCNSTPDIVEKKLKEISVTGMTIAYVNGDLFSFDGTCTAIYSVTINDVAQDDEKVNVTPTSVSEPNMNTPGTQTVTVSYTDPVSGETATTTYDISIASSVTFNAEIDIAPVDQKSITKPHITFTTSNGKLDNGKEYRLYQSSTTTFAAEEGYVITKIVFNCLSSDPASGFGNSNEGFTYTSNGLVGTWLGNSSVVELKATSKQVRAKTITVYYEQSSSETPDPEVPTHPTGLPEGVYQKVTAEPKDWSGEYILVYDDGNGKSYVWNGNDENNGYVLTSSSNDIISGAFVTITLAPMTGGYSVQVNGGDNNGKYIGGQSGNNKIVYDTKEILNTIQQFNFGTVMTSDSYVMSFNAATDVMRFRYYQRNKQSSVQLYKKQVYTRPVTQRNFGTICLPYGSSNYSGATFYEIVGQQTGQVLLGSVATLEAGMPYIFCVEDGATQISVTYEGTEEPDAQNKNGLYGTYTYTSVQSGDYIISEGQRLAPSDGTCWVDANRAYVVMREISGDTSTHMPGRRYIGMDVQGENQATELENIVAPEGQILKVIENGQLIIIRNGEKYNVQGQKL